VIFTPVFGERVIAKIVDNKKSKNFGIHYGFYIELISPPEFLGPRYVVVKLIRSRCDICRAGPSTRPTGDRLKRRLQGAQNTRNITTTSSAKSLVWWSRKYWSLSQAQNCLRPTLNVCYSKTAYTIDLLSQQWASPYCIHDALLLWRSFSLTPMTSTPGWSTCSVSCPMRTVGGTSPLCCRCSRNTNRWWLPVGEMVATRCFLLLSMFLIFNICQTYDLFT